MVKSNQPLQIRLTEPVVFLRGPSTGLDFRGRPIGIDTDAPPAMLRGLLTLRLTKGTRIRSIAVKLEGVSRTEWPEGIGPRRLDTFEEHTIISDSTSFFDARRRGSRSRDRSTRRAASVGPGAYIAQSEQSSDDADHDHEEVPGDGGEDWTAIRSPRGRERERGIIPRSASAMPGMLAGMGSWDGSQSGESRRPSFDGGPGSGSRGRSGALEPGGLDGVRGSDRRGPSPAYTPRAQSPAGRAPSSLRLNDTARPSRETVLSPIQSAAPSRAPSDRDNSAEAIHRRPSGSGSIHMASEEVAEATEPESEEADAELEMESPGVMDENGDESEAEPRGRRPTDIDEDHHHAIRSILSAGPSGGRRQSSGGEVRFAPPTRATAIEGEEDIPEGHEGETEAESAGRRQEYHHAHSAISAISAVSTAHNSPAPSRPGSVYAASRPGSVRPRASTDTLQGSGSDHAASAPTLAVAPASEAATTAQLSPQYGLGDTGPSASAASSRPPSLFAPDSRRPSRPGSMHLSAASSSTSLQEVRQGRKNRLGSPSTIVVNTDPNDPTAGAAPELPTSPLAQGSTSASRPPSINNIAGASGGPYGRPSLPTSSSSSTSGPRAESSGPNGIDGGRKGRFSLAATLRGLSQDVKDRVRQSSKSRTRQSSTGPASSSTRARNGSTTDIPVPPLPAGHRPSLGARERDESTSRSRSTHRQTSSSSFFHPDAGPVPSSEPSMRSAIRRGSGSFTRDPDFVPPGGSRGAARINTSRERSGSRMRTESPAPGPGQAMDRRTSVMVDERRGGRSESRGRGRNKGMKVLTDALGLGDGRVDVEEEGEDQHNWREFRKGTYNYPISFPIPVSTPPTVHAEFGSVTYRLKATVVRVGALTPNLTEEVEVCFIATPQEDDLEETENVIVERQWEEQMRYQIALSGKAFPIGGIIPVSLRIMPLMKCKIHRLTCVLEEKTDYFAQNRKVIRHETPRRFSLLFIKQLDTRPSEPLLPIISESSDAARTSPLAPLARAAALSNPSAFTNFAGEHDEDALYAGMMDPLGPWAMETELQVPDCAVKVRFTTKHEKSNMSVSHWLKVTIRVERGDDVALDSKGKRKQFDIIIETPIKILDCRVNPQWNSLPTYSSNSPSSTSALSGMCSIHGTKHTAASASSRPSAPTRNGSGGSPYPSAGTSRIDGLPAPHTNGSAGPSGQRREEGDDTLLERNIVFDRLMSGQETEAGDVPPSYGEALAAPAGGGAERGRDRREGSGSTSRSATPTGAGAGGRLGRVRDDTGDYGGSRSRSRLRQEV